uniref:Uncharacterized protein n=1 Tax=Ceratitis capitata TaxID=7213 RepID=W8BQX4_CERCA
MTIYHCMPTLNCTRTCTHLYICKHRYYRIGGNVAGNGNDCGDTGIVMPISIADAFEHKIAYANVCEPTHRQVHILLHMCMCVKTINMLLRAKKKFNKNRTGIV